MKIPFPEVFADETKNGTKIKTSDYQISGTYPIIDQGQDFIAGYTDSENGLYTDIPAIIFGDHTRVLKYVDFPFFLGADGTKILKARKAHSNYRYLYYALKSVRIPDTGYNRHFKWLKEATVSILDSQKQESIVFTLDSISRIISHRKSQLAKLDELVKCRFVEMFGDPVTNPQKWPIVTVQDIVTEVKYGTSRPAVAGGKYPYLRMNNITYDGKLDLSDVKRIDVPDDELPKCTVKRGDILFNRTNSKELVGKTCLYDKDELMVLAGFIIRVRVNELVIPEFLVQFMNMPTTKALLFAMCRNAVSQANINAKELQSISIYLPSLDMQKQFSAFTHRVDKLRIGVQAALEKAQTLFDSLMQEYFG